MREPSASPRPHQKPYADAQANSDHQRPTRKDRDKPGLRLSDLDDSQRLGNESTTATLMSFTPAIRTTTKSVPNLGSGQDRFATDRHRVAVDDPYACVLNYGLEDLGKLRFASRCN